MWWMMHYKWGVSKHFHTSLDTHTSPESPPAEEFHRFLLLKGAVHHYKVTNLDTVDGELGVERKCKIQLYLWQHTQISRPWFQPTEHMKISWKAEGSPNVSEGSGDTSASQQLKPSCADDCPKPPWLLRANLASAVIASVLSSAPWWQASLLQQQPGHGHHHEPTQHCESTHAQECSYQSAVAGALCGHTHIRFHCGELRQGAFHWDESHKMS